VPSGISGSPVGAASIIASTSCIGRHVAVEHEVLLHLRQLTADALEHRRELRVHIDDGGVAVVGDVRGLLVTEAIVQRHRRDTQLAGGVDHQHEANAVLPAPHDLRVAGAHAEVEQHVGQLVRASVELRERHRVQRAVGSVVDHRQLVRLRE
jgi:hypothetical protein